MGWGIGEVEKFEKLGCLQGMSGESGFGRVELAFDPGAAHMSST